MRLRKFSWYGGTGGTRWNARDQLEGWASLAQRKNAEEITESAQRAQSRQRRIRLFCFQAVAEVVDGVFDAFFEGHTGLPIEDFACPGDVRLADLGVIHGQRAVLDGGGTAGDADDVFGKFFDGHLGGVADVDGLMEVAHGQPVDAVDKIADVTEGAGLGTIAEDGERLVGEGLADKGGDYPAIAQPHAWAVSVEDADDLGIDFVIAVVSHGNGFGEALGLIVNAAGPDRVDVAPIALGLGMDQGVAVALGGGGEEEGGFFCLGEAGEEKWKT